MVFYTFLTAQGRYWAEMIQKISIHTFRKVLCPVLGCVGKGR